MPQQAAQKAAEGAAHQQHELSQGLRGRFGIDLGSIWGRSGDGLGSIWDRCGIDLGPMWGLEILRARFFELLFRVFRASFAENPPTPAGVERIGTYCTIF